MILKLPGGGSIVAHRSILAAVSPVFEKMFYGSLKEGKSMTVDLPKDNYKSMGLLIDFVYRGRCELNLDEIFPILEAFDQYQINKVPFCHMCSDVILAQMESTNYLTLLEKFAKVMSEEGIKKAANKVMAYTNIDFISKFDTTKDLPEEMLLQLLQMDITNHEVDIFNFLVKWHDYQTKDLGRSLQLTQKLFQNIRYSLIIPQILTSKVLPRSDLVNKQLLIDAYYYIYNSCKPLGEYDSKECTLEPTGLTFRKPRCSLEMQWSAHQGTMQRDKLDDYRVSFHSQSVGANQKVMISSPLRNGVYTFSIINITPKQNLYSISIAVRGQHDKYLYFHPLISNNLITVYVHNEYLFLKLIEGDKVKSTTSITLEENLFSICICNIAQSQYNISFSIHNHMQ